MKITGFQKTSLIDYPGHIVSIIFTQGCSFKCPYCHNSDLISPDSKDKEYFPVEYIYSFISNRKGLIDGISITGGEPTLQPDLYDFITEVKSMGLKIKLDTNGSNPEILEPLLKENLLDYIAMDVKASLFDYEDIINAKININSIIRSISLIQNSAIQYEFRTTVVPGLHDIEQLKEIAILLKGSKKYFIQNFKANNTFDKDYMQYNSFPPSKLEKFKEICIPYINKVEIRD